MNLEREIKSAEGTAMMAQQMADDRGLSGDIKYATRMKKQAAWFRELKEAREIIKNYDDGRISEKAALQQLKEALKEIREFPEDAFVVMPYHLGWPRREK